VAQLAIPQYALYGEAIQDVDERFLHIESIAERSRLHDWTIRPHAHRDLHHLLFVQRGGGTLKAEGEEHVFPPPSLIEIPVSCVHSFEFRPGTDGWIVTASGALIGRLAREHTSLTGVLHEAGTIRLTNDTAAELTRSFDALVKEFRGQLPARRAAAEAWLTTILVQALRRKLALAPEAQRTGGADAVLAARYRALVEKNFAKPHRVADYAERLCISHERLRQACVRSTASSPLELLNARRLLEAKRCLLYTNMSVTVIAEHCGFEDPAYFSRFFARAVGKSPLQYRKMQIRRQRDG
jgi:AraC family transcriptional activator of pobA